MELVRSIENSYPQLFKALRFGYKTLQHAKDQYLDGIKTYTPKEFCFLQNLPINNFSAWNGFAAKEIKISRKVNKTIHFKSYN